MQQFSIQKQHTDLTCFPTVMSYTQSGYPNCRFYGSAKGCKYGNNCNFSHNNPQSVPLCRNMQLYQSCSFGNQCSFRHQYYNTLPVTTSILSDPQTQPTVFTPPQTKGVPLNTSNSFIPQEKSSVFSTNKPNNNNNFTRSMDVNMRREKCGCKSIPCKCNGRYLRYESYVNGQAERDYLKKAIRLFRSRLNEKLEIINNLRFKTLLYGKKQKAHGLSQPQYQHLLLTNGYILYQKTFAENEKLRLDIHTLWSKFNITPQANISESFFNAENIGESKIWEADLSNFEEVENEMRMESIKIHAMIARKDMEITKLIEEIDIDHDEELYSDKVNWSCDYTLRKIKNVVVVNTRLKKLKHIQERDALIVAGYIAENRNNCDIPTSIEILILCHYTKWMFVKSW